MLEIDAVQARIADVLRRHGGGEWLDQADARLDASDDLSSDANLLISGARRALGRRVAGDPVELRWKGEDVSTLWTLTELGRAYVLVRMLKAAGENDPDLADLVWNVYRFSDDAEKVAIVKSLAFLPDNARWKALALDATRTNSPELLSALLVRNTYPADHFNDKQFNGLVLKALFMRIGIADLPGLGKRSSAELSRMCEDYVQELRDAGREVPADIWLAMAGSMSERGRQFLREYASGTDVRHRLHAALAIERHLSGIAEWKAFVRDRLERESEASVLSVLNRMGG